MKSELLAVILPSAISLISAMFAFFIAWFRTRTVKVLSHQLDEINALLDSVEMRYYIVCPHCNERIYMTEVDIQRGGVVNHEK
nr:MAG TPA: zinc-ribbon domain protein [Microviridae sp.]